jgi:hypothetical protein
MTQLAGCQCYLYKLVLGHFWPAPWLLSGPYTFLLRFSFLLGFMVCHHNPAFETLKQKPAAQSRGWLGWILV